MDVIQRFTVGFVKQASLYGVPEEQALQLLAKNAGMLDWAKKLFSSETRAPRINPEYFERTQSRSADELAAAITRKPPVYPRADEHPHALAEMERLKAHAAAVAEQGQQALQEAEARHAEQIAQSQAKANQTAQEAEARHAEQIAQSQAKTKADRTKFEDAHVILPNAGAALAGLGLAGAGAGAGYYFGQDSK